MGEFIWGNWGEGVLPLVQEVKMFSRCLSEATLLCLKRLGLTHAVATKATCPILVDRYRFDD